MAYIQCVSSFFSSRKGVFRNLLSNSKSFPGLSCARPHRGTLPGERDEAYLAALQSSSSNLHPPSPLPAHSPEHSEASPRHSERSRPTFFLPGSLLRTGRPAQRGISLLFAFLRIDQNPSTFPLYTEMRRPTQWRLCSVLGGALSQDCQRGIS